MATPAPAAPKSSSSTFLLLISFVVVAFIIFDPTMRDYLGRAVGFVFTPLLGFGGRHPLWTVTLAGIIMILASTVVRHFLVDWVKMARVQEVMRHFQKEFRDAQKSNNSYKMKRLTDAQPEILQLQSEMSGEQLKPMALTMIVVIPIFIWLSTFMAAPVHYDATYEGTGDVLILAYGDALYDADVLRAGAPASLELVQNAHIHGLAATPGASGQARLDSIMGDTDVDLASVGALSGGQLLNTTAGKHTVRTVDNLDMWNVEEPAKLDRVLLVVTGADGRIARTYVVGPMQMEFTLEAGETVTAYVPAPVNAEARGNPVQLHVDGARVADFGAGDLLVLASPDGAATLVPKGIQVPWNRHWDLNVSWWVLPHWILLYSMISIPLGTVTQKILKKWEFKKVDLDGDGVPMGRTR